MTLGNMLKAARKAKRLTQRDIADKLGISPQSVSMWESNATRPGLGNASKLANILGLEKRWLITQTLEEFESSTEQLSNPLQSRADRTWRGRTPVFDIATIPALRRALNNPQNPLPEAIRSVVSPEIATGQTYALEFEDENDAFGILKGDLLIFDLNRFPDELDIVVGTVLGEKVPIVGAYRFNPSDDPTMEWIFSFHGPHKGTYCDGTGTLGTLIELRRSRGDHPWTR